MKGYGIISMNNPGWLEKDRPACGALDAIVRPLLVAPCTSDVHTLHGGAGPRTNMILGHEAVGEIVEVGEAVKKFKAGDVVVVPAGTPDWLELGVQNGVSFSHDTRMLGSFKFCSQKDGSFAEFFHVNQADANLVLQPKNVSLEAACMTVDMMSTGFYGVEMCDVGYGESVVVIGIGPVGLMAIAAAALRGAGRIIGVGTRPNCVEIAREYGATDIVSYKEGNIVEQVLDLTGGVDKVVIAGGNADTVGQAIAMAKTMGTIANVNYFDASATISFPTLAWGLGMGDKTIKGGFCPSGALRIQRMLDLIEYRGFDPTKIITHRYEGFEAIEEAFEVMGKKPADLIKPIINISWE